jgi:hypothetical protein
MIESQIFCFPVSDAHWEANDGRVTRIARPVGSNQDTGHVCPAIETIVLRVNGPGVRLKPFGGFNQKPASAIIVTFSSTAGNANENGKSTKGNREIFEIILILSASPSLQNVMLSEEFRIVVDEFENLVSTSSAEAWVGLSASAVET